MALSFQSDVLVALALLRSVKLVPETVLLFPAGRVSHIPNWDIEPSAQETSHPLGNETDRMGIEKHAS